MIMMRVMKKTMLEDIDDDYETRKMNIIKAAPSTHSRKNRLLLVIFSNFTNSGGITYSLMIA